ncbi:major facilitator superfamily domain-containing protein, partial [Xylariales sp. PMI_506]
REDDRVPLQIKECKNELAYGFSFSKKWVILSIIALVQISMNLNTTLYSNGLKGMAKEWNIDDSVPVWGAFSFLFTYAFACELWAPWSEEFGRKWVLQLSLFLVNLTSIGSALAPNIATQITFRALGGLSTAGGSITLGLITDMFETNDPWNEYAKLFIVWSSVSGSIFGPIIGGFVEVHLHWRWTIWIQLIFGFLVQMLHLCFVPETRATILMDATAKRWRASPKNRNKYGPGELAPRRTNWRDTFAVWGRPFKMLFCEPIVLTQSLLSGFSDGLIFMQVQSFTYIYAKWNFGPIELGYAFIPLLVGDCLAVAIFIPFIRYGIRIRREQPNNNHAQYEGRLKILLFLAPLLPLGLLLFAFTAAFAVHPLHWVGTTVATCLIGIANFAIYQATIDYTLRAYGQWAASATGGNGFARDFIAACLTPAAAPLYTTFGGKGEAGRPGTDPIFRATMLLFAISVVLTGAIFVVYFYGQTLRRRSRFAQDLAEEEE